jgi:hypothetical protein
MHNFSLLRKASCNSWARYVKLWTCLAKGLRVYVRHFPGIPYSVAGHVVSWRSLPLSYSCPSVSHICKSVLFGSDKPDYTCVETGVGFELCQPQDAIHLLLHEKHLLKLKGNGTELSCLKLRTCVKKMTLSSGKRTGKIATLNELEHNLNSEFISKHMFYFTAI